MSGWTKTTNLKGPQGPQGQQGAQGTPGQQGAAGPRGPGFFSGTGAPAGSAGDGTYIVGDNYLDLSTGDVYKLS